MEYCTPNYYSTQHVNATRKDTELFLTNHSFAPFEIPRRRLRRTIAVVCGGGPREWTYHSLRIVPTTSSPALGVVWSTMKTSLAIVATLALCNAQTEVCESPFVVLLSWLLHLRLASAPRSCARSVVFRVVSVAITFNFPA